MRQLPMPTETAAGAIAAFKYGLFAKLGAILGAGVLGALVIAAVDPAEAMPDPKKRRRLIFLQVFVALVVAGLLGPGLTSWLTRPAGLFPVTPGDLGALIEAAMPVGLALGALSWGLIGAGVKIRQIIADRGAAIVARKAGLTD